MEKTYAYPERIKININMILFIAIAAFILYIIGLWSIIKGSYYGLILCGFALFLIYINHQVRKHPFIRITKEEMTIYRYLRHKKEIIKWNEVKDIVFSDGELEILLPNNQKIRIDHSFLAEEDNENLTSFLRNIQTALTENQDVTPIFKPKHPESIKINIAVIVLLVLGSFALFMIGLWSIIKGSYYGLILCGFALFLIYINHQVRKHPFIRITKEEMTIYRYLRHKKEIIKWNEVKDIVFSDGELEILLPNNQKIRIDHSFLAEEDNEDLINILKRKILELNRQ